MAMNLSDNQATAVAAEWLEVGDRYETRFEPGAWQPDVDVAIDVTLELREAWEEFDTRRVFVAAVKKAEPAAGEDDSEALSEEVLGSLIGTDFVVEQESEDMRVEGESRDDALDKYIRLPVARQALGPTTVSLYRNDAGLTLGELLEVSTGMLNLAQIRGVFLPLVDAIADLHDHGFLHLRLTPWTVRVRDPDEASSMPIEFLKRTMEAPGLNVPAGLGDEDTVSEVVEEPADADREAPPGEVLAAPPTGDEADQPAAVALGDKAKLLGSEPRAELGVLFDGIDGYFSVAGDLDTLPVIRGFSPPELFGRAGAQISTACDVFNLGLLLYFLVAGELPPVSVYTRHAPAIPARNLRPSFPPGLEPVISRATRPVPAERYPDVETLRDDFIQACETIEARQEVEVDPPVEVAVDRHVGIAKGRRNPENQDNVFGKSSDDGAFALVVIADGVSTASYGSGEIASRLLAEETAEAWEEILPQYLMDEDIDAPAIIDELLSRANDRIVDYVNEHYLPFRGSPHEVMGTTALVGLYVRGTLTVGALGDSRVYLQRAGAFEQLTIDHNLWTLSILEGVAADSALAMPHGDALARCLGTFVIENQRLRAVPPNPDLFQFQLIPGDRVLMTTDGLVDFAGANSYAATDNILNVLLSEPNAALACLELILLANRGGGGDNIGVGILNVG